MVELFWLLIETNEIANLRGFKMENHVESLDDFSLIDSGHILGSQGIAL